MEHILVILTEGAPELLGTFVDLAECMIEAAKVEGSSCVDKAALAKLNEAGGMPE